MVSKAQQTKNDLMSLVVHCRFIAMCWLFVFIVSYALFHIRITGSHIIYLFAYSSNCLLCLLHSYVTQSYPIWMEYSMKWSIKKSQKWAGKKSADSIKYGNVMVAMSRNCFVILYGVRGCGLCEVQWKMNNGCFFWFFVG